LKETCCKDHAGNRLSEELPIQNDVKKKKETLFRHCFSS